MGWSGSPGRALTRAVKVLDTGDLVLWKEKLAKLPDIKPLERRPLDRAVIQVEAIDVHIGLHVGAGGKSRGRPFGTASRLAPEGTRGVTSP